MLLTVFSMNYSFIKPFLKQTKDKKIQPVNRI